MSGRFVPLPDGSSLDLAAVHELLPDERPRCDGWTADRQRRFLTALAQGLSVQRACDIVDMSRTAAYAFRTSPRGAAFALGWEAAQIRARDVLADELMDRALHGVKEQVIADDGRITTRKRHDNRLAWNLLTRLDRACDPTKAAPRQHAAALAAQDFDHYLDLLDESGPSGGPARAGLFLATRIGAAADPAAAAQELEPVRALARADRWVRSQTGDEGQGAPAPDPAARAEWTAADWARAEALGLVALAPEPTPEPAAPENAPDCQLCQLVQESTASDGGYINPDNPDDEPVWYCTAHDEWRTSFPPPPDFFGDEELEYGDADYNRALSEEESTALRRSLAGDLEDPNHPGHQARQTWLDSLLIPPLQAEAAAQSTDEGASKTPKVIQSAILPPRNGEGDHPQDGGGVSPPTIGAPIPQPTSAPQTPPPDPAPKAAETPATRIPA